MRSVWYQSASVITAILRATIACNRSDGEYVRIDTNSNEYYSRGRKLHSTGLLIIIWTVPAESVKLKTLEHIMVAFLKNNTMTTCQVRKTLSCLQAFGMNGEKFV